MASFLEKIIWQSFVSDVHKKILICFRKREGKMKSPSKIKCFKNFFYSCGGSIMNENWVLSAGHCCAGLGDDGEIVAGTNDRYDGN